MWNTILWTILWLPLILTVVGVVWFFVTIIREELAEEPVEDIERNKALNAAWDELAEYFPNYPRPAKLPERPNCGRRERY